MEHEEVFFVMFVLSLISVVVLRKRKGDMGGREWICVAIGREMEEMAWKALSLWLISAPVNRC